MNYFMKEAISDYKKYGITQNIINFLKGNGYFDFKNCNEVEILHFLYMVDDNSYTMIQAITDDCRLGLILDIAQRLSEIDTYNFEKELTILNNSIFNSRHKENKDYIELLCKFSKIPGADIKRIENEILSSENLSYNDINNIMINFPSLSLTNFNGFINLILKYGSQSQIINFIQKFIINNTEFDENNKDFDVKVIENAILYENIRCEIEDSFIYAKIPGINFRPIECVIKRKIEKGYADSRSLSRWISCFKDRIVDKKFFKQALDMMVEKDIKSMHKDSVDYQNKQLLYMYEDVSCSKDAKEKIKNTICKIGDKETITALLEMI